MNEATADAVAAALLKAECLNVRIDPPFRLVSGLVAPFYIDCRHVLGHPGCRSVIVERLVERARRLSPFEVVAGGVTAGVPFATLLADRLEKPLAYVRSEAKAHGLGVQVEGADVRDRSVLLVEDLMTTGDSSLKFAGILRDHGARIDRCLVVLDRSRDGNPDRFAAAEVSLHSLCTMGSLLGRALAEGRIDAAMLAEAHAFIDHPSDWSARHAD
ncbi:MAG: orotate phosphoribosyltransferase [Alphaproteobacteria bacterium]